MSMVHDNIIKGYSVDFDAETLILKTLYQADEILENTDVVFTGYLAHDFDHVVKYNIIFDINEWPLSLYLERERDMLEKARKYGWPISYKTESELIGFFQVNGYKVYLIGSSCGLSGFVLAKNMNIIVNGERFIA